MKRILVPLVAAGVAASSLSYTAGSARAEGSKAFSGYSSTGVATPIKIEVFEPTIPMPTVPQGEFDLGYTKIKADSATTKARASFLWPGDGVGEGLKTFFEQLGLPTAPVENGYPLQVNAEYPGDTPSQEQSPFPGASSKARTEKGKSRATVGFSSNCDAGDGGDNGGGGGGGTPGGLPDLPDLPGLPGLPELPPPPPVPFLDSVSTAISATGREEAPQRRASEGSGRSRTGAGASGAAEEPDQPETPCQIPDQLAALVDVNGYVADTRSVADDKLATTTSRAALGDVRLIGGLVTFSGLTSTVVSTSDGKTGKAKGRADYGTVTIAGRTFAIGPEGYTAEGQSGGIPGLPDDPAAALAELGITVQVPQPVYKAVGDKATGLVEGLIVTIDFKTLRPALSQVQLGPVLDQLPIPPQMGPVKSFLGAIGNLSPRVVLHLGYTTTTVDTVQAIPIPSSVPDNDPGGDEPGDQGGGDGAAGAATGGGAAAGGSALGGSGAAAGGGTPAATSDTAAEPLTDAALSAGLPKLFSIPGLLMALGIGGALFAGSYVRRLGALVLGGAGSCPHGLDSGLPDLRQVH